MIAGLMCPIVSGTPGLKGRKTVVVIVVSCICDYFHSHTVAAVKKKRHALQYC